MGNELPKPGSVWRKPDGEVREVVAVQPAISPSTHRTQSWGDVVWRRPPRGPKRVMYSWNWAKWAADAEEVTDREESDE